MKRHSSTDPWLRYQTGDFNLLGWLADHSAALQHYLPFRNWVRSDFPDTMAFYIKRYHDTSASGYEPDTMIGVNIDVPPNPNDPAEAQNFKDYGNYQIAASRLGDLKSILDFRQNQGTSVLGGGNARPPDILCLCRWRCSPQAISANNFVIDHHQWRFVSACRGLPKHYSAGWSLQSLAFELHRRSLFQYLPGGSISHPGRRTSHELNHNGPSEMSITSLVFAVFCVISILVYWRLPQRLSHPLAVSRFDGVYPDMVMGTGWHPACRGNG